MKMRLKNIVIISLLLIFISLSLSSQAQQKPFKFGFKVSPALSWLSPDAKYYEQGGAAFSLSWGFVADITLMDHYYLSTGFNVSYFKGKLSYPHIYNNEADNYSYTGNMDRTYNLRYIEVPLAFKMKTNELAKNIKFFGLMGINTGFNIRAKANESFTGNNPLSGKHSYTEDKVDIKDETTLVKASLIVGAGIDYVIDESISIIIGVNFNNGFSNILKGTNTVHTDIDAKAVPYYFELNLGVIF